MIKGKTRHKRRMKFMISGKTGKGGKEYTEDSKRRHQRKEGGSGPQ